MNKLLDTNIFIDYLRGNQQAKQYLSKQSIIQCSLITAAELLQGANNKKAQLEAKKLLIAIKILPLSSSIGNIALSLISKYSLLHGIQIPDALIAATAIEENLILVTANIKHFSFIKELKLKDWKEI